MEVKEFKAKTVDEAITAATLELGISSDKLRMTRMRQLKWQMRSLLQTGDILNRKAAR